MSNAKLCVTYVKIFKKARPMQVAPDFIKELVKAGMPEDMAEELLESGKVIWEEDKIDHRIIYAAEII